MPAQIQFRRGKAAHWTDENPLLRDGEPGYETNTRRFKIGDGKTRWVDLPYQGTVTGSEEPPTSAELLAHIADTTPHPVYDDGPSLLLLYNNAKV